MIGTSSFRAARAQKSRPEWQWRPRARCRRSRGQPVADRPGYAGRDEAVRVDALGAVATDLGSSSRATSARPLHRPRRCRRSEGAVRARAARRRRRSSPRGGVRRRQRDRRGASDRPSPAASSNSPATRAAASGRASSSGRGHRAQTRPVAQRLPDQVPKAISRELAVGDYYCCTRVREPARVGRLILGRVRVGNQHRRVPDAATSDGTARPGHD